MKNLVLYPYQEEALAKVLWARTLPGNDLLILPTGAGKSILISNIVTKIDEPIVIFQPTKEILEQNLSKLLRYLPRESVGVYSASMDEKTIKHVTLATIGSVYRKSSLFRRFRMVILDEAHLHNPKKLSGMFSRFLNGIDSPKVIGLTATPYRLDTFFRHYGEGRFDIEAVATIRLINRMKEYFWQRILCNFNLSDLIDAGYLCPLVYKDVSVIEHEDIPLNTSASDFDLPEYEKSISQRQKEIISAIVYARTNHKSVLVFCSSVSQAEQLSRITPNSAVVTAKTHKKKRQQTVKAFKNNTLQTVFNVGVFTIGFDHPSLDCIVLLRPTRSVGLYYQMLGRGVRKSPGKTNCTVVDLTSTFKNIGRIESIRLEKLNGKWELVTGTGLWHGRELFKFRLPKERRNSYD